MLVLLWGLEDDAPLSAVRDQLELLNVPMKFIDQRRVLETEVELQVAATVEGELRVGDDNITLAEVGAVYMRCYDSVRLPEVAAGGSAAMQHAAEVDDVLASWTELTSALVVNRLSASAVNGSKPYQLAQIRNFGWSIPETLITTDPNEARDFWKRHGEVVYKSISAIRSRVSRLSPSHVERLADLASCPTQFQRFVPGTDYRVHVVDDNVFASEIRCSADDYRYCANEAPEIKACTLTPSLEQQCRRMATAMDLPLAGIDLRRTPQGEWFCFEVNPSPAFTYYEQMTGQPIGQAVALLLARTVAKHTSDAAEYLTVYGAENSSCLH
jgi:glutathione synthase/RimK-type ligase-like ATP-grasp enzyme